MCEPRPMDFLVLHVQGPGEMLSFRGQLFGTRSLGIDPGSEPASTLSSAATVNGSHSGASTSIWPRAAVSNIRTES